MSTLTTMQPTTNRQVPESIDPSETLYRLTVDEYEKLADVLEDERVELIDGLLVASQIPAWRRIAAGPVCMAPEAFLSIGSSTSSTARLKFIRHRRRTDTVSRRYTS
jgi:hypothetical protein